MRRARPTGVRIAHAIALCTALGALALALRQTPVLFIGLVIAAGLAVVVPFLEWTAVPLGLTRVLPRVLGIALLAFGGVAWLSRALGVLLLEPTFLPPLAVPLVPMAFVFALAPRAFSPGRTLVPSIISLLGLAGLNPQPAGYGRSALPFLMGGHNGFAELYLVLALVLAGALWTAAFLESGPIWRRRDVLALVLGVAVAVAFAAACVVGLPLLQPRIERALASTFDQGKTGLSGESTLGEFAELAVSRRRLLDLQASDPQAGPWLLRSEVFTAFDGRRWTNPPTPPPPARISSDLRPSPPPTDVGPLLIDVGSWFFPHANVAPGWLPARRSVDLRFNQQDVDDWPLLLPQAVAAVTIDAPSLGLDRLGNIRRPAGLGVHLYGARLADRARSASDPSLTPEDRRESLALPPVLDERLRALARSLAPGADPHTQLEATVEHLRRGYRYTLRPGAFHGDPLAEFLFEKKAGYCEYFASAAVVLLRLQGVPARFVKGLSVGPQTDVGGGLHVVRESDAHAWVEAWMPAEGWVEADPTPPGQFAETHGRTGYLQRLAEHVRSAVSALWARLVARGPISTMRQLARDIEPLVLLAARSPAVCFLAATAAFGPRLVRFWLARRRRRLAAAIDGGDVPRELRARLREIERRWTALGRPRPAHRGFLEHSHAIASERLVEADIGIRTSERDVIDAYYRVRFGGDLFLHGHHEH